MFGHGFMVIAQLINCELVRVTQVKALMLCTAKGPQFKTDRLLKLILSIITNSLLFLQHISTLVLEALSIYAVFCLN